MRRILTIPGLLILTGITSAIVLAMPWLIIFGFLAFIIPGFLMALAPTAFCYLLVFWLCSTALSGLGRPIAILSGMAVCAVVGWGFPFVLNAPTDRALTEVKARDFAGVGKIPIVTTIALLQPPFSTLGEKTDESMCDELCLMLLFSGTAKIVAMGPSQQPPHGWTKNDSRSAAYRIERREACPDMKFGGVEWSAEGNEHTAEIFEVARQRMAQGECLVAIFDEQIRPDLTIRRLTAGEAYPPSRLSPVAGPIRSNVIELVRCDQIVARSGDYFAARLKSPLMVLPYTVGKSVVGWEFSRHGRYDQKMDAVALIRRFTGWALTPPTPETDATRTLIDAALVDKGRLANDPAFGLIDTYFSAITLRKVEATEEDTRLITRVIADSRITKLWHVPVWSLPLSDATLRNALRDAILARMLAERENREIHKALANYLDAFPSGSFADASSLYDEVLADPVLGSLGTVNARLADKGNEIVDELVKRVAEDRRPLTNLNTDMEMRSGALRGLCRLGASAASARDRLETLARNGTLSVRTQESDLWRVTMVALGAPASRFAFPSGTTGSIDLYHQRLERQAREGCKQTG